MKLCIVGTGYVGLVSAACFAEMGNSVTCIDVNKDVVARLNAGSVHIFEPGLEPMVRRSHADGRLKFTTSLAEGLVGADCAFICVGTPPGEDGSCDLHYVEQVAREIGRTMENDLIVVDKSTVPVGTADRVRAIITEELAARGKNFDFEVVSNPEFLKEGDAISDFMKPDRVVIGTSSDKAAATMRELYAPFARTRDKLIVMGIRSAEMTKYAANAMLATRISFMNEIANLCDRVGVLLRGRLVEEAPAAELFSHPQHPYTRALISAMPLPDPIRERNRKLKTFDPETLPTEGALREVAPDHFVLTEGGSEI